MTAIFDVYDALTSERPYKKPWSNEDALKEVRRLSGLAFDPELVALFVDNLPRFDGVARSSPEVPE
jgi:putative two-component system response regulator